MPPNNGLQGDAPRAVRGLTGRFGTASESARCNQIGGLKSAQGEDTAVKHLRRVVCAASWSARFDLLYGLESRPDNGLTGTDLTPSSGWTSYPELDGGTMRKGSLFAFVAAFLCSVLSAQPQGRQGEQTQLPEGNGKEMVQAMCTGATGST
jgi:hypothetical protein